VDHNKAKFSRAIETIEDNLLNTMGISHGPPKIDYQKGFVFQSPELPKSGAINAPGAPGVMGPSLASLHEPPK
jgi:hypothetical protein